MKQTTALWKEETGSAILLSLGVLSLVLILAMSFAFSANTQKAIAKTQGAATSARMVADQSVDLAIADMKFMFSATHNNTHPSASVAIYPPEALNKDEATQEATAPTFDQSCFLFRRFKPDLTESVSATNPYLMNYLVSTDVGRSGSDAPSAWEKHYVGHLFGLAAEATAVEESYGSTDLKTDWLKENALKDKVNYLPQLQFLSESLMDTLGFAPALTMTYTLRDEEKNTESFSKVTGRYAYILLDETAKFDINSVISLTGDIPVAIDHTAKTAVDQNRVLGGGMYCDRLAPSLEVEITGGATDIEYDYGTLVANSYESSASQRYSEVNTFRLGMLPEEIEVDQRYADFMTGGKAKSPYESYDQLCESSYTTPTTTRTKFVDTAASPKAIDSEMFLYTFFGMEDIEAYWNGNKEVQRFDLSGISWGHPDKKLYNPAATPVENAWEYGKGDQSKSRQLIWRLCGLDDTSKPDASPIDEPLPFWKDRAAGKCYYSVEETNGDINDYQGYLNWLHRMMDNDGKNVGVQVAANIKDFSDSDDFASTDFNFTASAPSGDEYAPPEAFSEPNYCGNERVCYFNEVTVKQDCWRKLDTATAALNYNVSLTVGVEMLNIYCLTGKPNCGASGKTASGTECTIPLGDVHVKLFGKLHVWKQTYKEVDDPSYSGSGTAPKIWQADGVPSNDFNWELKSADSTGAMNFLTLNSKDAGTCFGLDETALSELPQDHHLGFTTFLLKKSKTVSELGDICTATSAELNTIAAQGSESEGNKYHFAFVFTIDRVVAYTTDTNKDLDVNALYDVAVTPTGGDNPYSANQTNIVTSILDNVNLDEVSFGNSQFIVDFQVRDCRINHRADAKFWLVTAVKDEADDAGKHTLDADNDDNGTSLYQLAADSNAAVDMEKNIHFLPRGATGQTTFSTAFIRNAPMESLWELGAIHRGYPFQTINLKDYSKASETGNVYYSTAVNAAGGDAGILDQVKIGPLMFVKGKINANQRNPFVWKKLLTDANLDYDWYDSEVCDELNHPEEYDKMQVVGIDFAGWEITADDIDKLLKTGKAWDGYPAAEQTSTSRGAVAYLFDELLMTKTHKPANDRDYELYIGKTAGLLTTRTEAYSLLLVAESLNDLTEEVADKDEWDVLKKTLVNPQTVMADMNKDGDCGDPKDTRYCTVTGRQKVLVHLVRDAWQNEISVHSKRYLGDE